MPFLERPSARIAYDVLGEGPPLILGHSLLCGRWMWEGVLPQLADKFRVYNVEFRGHGESKSATAFSLDDLALDWLALMDQEGLEKASFLGLSMGAMTAMRLALRAPSRVQALALLNTSADPETRANKIQYAAMSASYKLFGFNSLLLSRITPIMLGAKTLEQAPQLAQQLGERVRTHDRKQLLRAIAAVNHRDDVYHRLTSVTCPTLVVYGEEDNATPPDRSHRIADRIAHSKLVGINGVGHLSAWEAPDKVAPLILEFLSQNV